MKTNKFNSPSNFFHTRSSRCSPSNVLYVFDVEYFSLAKLSFPPPDPQRSSCCACACASLTNAQSNQLHCVGPIDGANWIVQESHLEEPTFHYAHEHARLWAFVVVRQANVLIRFDSTSEHFVQVSLSFHVLHLKRSLLQAMIVFYQNINNNNIF